MNDGDKNYKLSKDWNTYKALFLSVEQIRLIFLTFRLVFLSSFPPSPLKLLTPSVGPTAKSAVGGDKH